MTIDDIVTLIQAVSDNGLTSFEYEEGDQKLTLKKKKKKHVMMPVTASSETVAGVLPSVKPAVLDVEVKEKKQPVDIGSDHVVESPLVGTFYSSASPEADPFVKVGDTVKKGQVLGIIEAMKLMNEIESEYDGVVEAILVNNEDVVEYGQPLFRIK